MGKFIDLTGKTIENWNVLSYLGNRRWLCRCSCGKEKSVHSDNLLQGKSKSCGCLKNKDKITHHQSNSKLYNVWRGIKTRCYNTNSEKYFMYGGRGISMCDEWKDDFDSFFQWAKSAGYDEQASYGVCTIDRINTNGNYEPNNCRWVDSKIQANNTRKNRIITYQNQTHTLSEWVRIFNLPYSTVSCRLHRGWNIIDALTIPKKR